MVNFRNRYGHCKSKVIFSHLNLLENVVNKFWFELPNFVTVSFECIILLGDGRKVLNLNELSINVNIIAISKSKILFYALMYLRELKLAFGKNNEIKL